jgi:hypothetical protein
MPAHQCRINAERCLSLAKHATRPETRQRFNVLAETWTRLAAQLEADESLLTVLSELEPIEPSDALPRALGLHSCHFRL